MTFHTDVSEISVSYIYGAEALAVMASCQDDEEGMTIDDDTNDDNATTVFGMDDGATTVFDRPSSAMA